MGILLYLGTGGKGCRVSGGARRSCLGGADGSSAFDRALIRGRPAFAKTLRRGRQGERECGPWPLVWLGPQPAAMRLDDRARDGQSHAHAVGFCGVKRLEQPLHLARFETSAHILHAEAGLRYSITYLAAPADYENPLRFLDGLHRIQSIDDEVKENLLQLHSVSENERKVLGQIGTDGCLTRGELRPCKRADIRNDIP